MNKLELKHLAPYLPYKLKLKFCSPFETDRLSKENTVYLKEIKEGYIYVNGYQTNNISYLPILRPMRDVSNYIDELQLVDSFHTHYCYITNTVKLYPDGGFENVEWAYLTDNYILLNKLFELHFDVFGLIDKGLAIDINKYNGTNL